MKKYIIIAACTWFLIGIFYFYCNNWVALGAIATWMLVASVFFAILQVWQAKKSTNAQIAMEIFRELRSEETLEKLRFIYSLKAEDEELRNLHKKDKESIDFVLDRLNVLGHLLDRGIVDESLVIEGFSGPAVLRCWYQLKPYIRFSQEERGSYVENYEVFANRCIEYFKEKRIRVKFSNDYQTIEDLVTKLKQDREYRPRSLREINKARKHNKRGSAK